MRRTLLLASALSAVTLAAATPAFAAEPATPPPAPVADLVASLKLPYDQFTLPNGLTVLVHTDRKAPVVAVSMWYAVGSKNEPRGRTGFAHLFEHLMFYGSEHNPGNYFAPLEEVGGTNMNGNTWLDRTTYFETVPTGALDRALMMESDRMGWLLSAMTQGRVDAQRAVVKNEKRQRDNEPYGLVEYEQQETLYPAGHPYHHETIGSMDDLDKASLDDVKGWFHDHYGPNNAILVLAGDIDLATAKAKTMQWFGPIAPGPKVQPVSVPVVPLAAPVSHTMADQVATTRIMRMWAVPGLDNPDYLPLQIGATILGGLGSSRLSDHLVHGQEIAVDGGADAQPFAQGGQLVAIIDLKPGQDAAKAGAALDAEIARLVNDGPIEDELQRAVMAYVSNTIRSLESVGGGEGQAPTLAQGLLYNGDPMHFRAELEQAARMTPADVRAAMQKWLRSPAFSLTIVPGKRTEGGEHRGGDDALPPLQPAPPVPAGLTATPSDASRAQLPAPAQLDALPFPAIERTTLKNGIKVFFARRSAVPVVSMRLSFDAGFAADPAARRGTQALLLKLMDEGTDTLGAVDWARARERLGASLGAGSGADETTFQLNALVPNLAASLALFNDYVRHPGLRTADLARVRAQQLSAIDAEAQDPGGIAQRTLLAALYGAGHPYGTSANGIGDKAAVAKLTRAELLAWHHAWLRPDRANLFVVGDTTLDALKPMLEQTLGAWAAPTTPAPHKAFVAAPKAGAERIVLIDRPGTPQAEIVAGELIDARRTDDLLNLRTANEVLGGAFLARFTQNLREDKGWSYGTYSWLDDRAARASWMIDAPVQTDKAGASIGELRKEITGYLGEKPTSPRELALTAAGDARKLPGRFETSGAVLDGVDAIITNHRPDDWYTRLPDRYRALTAADLDAAARAKLTAKGIVWVVVGDAAKIRPQVKALGLPITEVKAGS